MKPNLLSKHCCNLFLTILLVSGVYPTQSMDLCYANKNKEKAVTYLIQDTIPETAALFSSNSEEMPRFPGCEDIEGSSSEKEKCAKMKMILYVYKNIEYPKEALDKGIEGTAVVQFTVDITGELIGIYILRDPGYGLGEAAVKLVESMNEQSERWIPGKLNGKLVKVLYTLPIVFKTGRTDSKYRSVPKGEHLYDNPRKMPRFPGCEDMDLNHAEKEACAEEKMMTFFKDNLRYPAEASFNFAEGIVEVEFVVDPYGDIYDISILNDPGYGMGQEAIRLIEEMNNLPEAWSPGVQGRKEVYVLYKVSIPFELDQ